MMLGFPLSLLFFMDQNIAESMVNSPDNKLMKGTSYHWDMFVVGCLNIPLSIFCMPWMHAVLPHSPLHVRALADIDEGADLTGGKQQLHAAYYWGSEYKCKCNIFCC